MHSVRRVMFVGMAPADAERYLGAMEKLPFEVEVEADAGVAAQRLETEKIDAVVAAYPLAAGEIGTLVSQMRTGFSPNLATGLVLMAVPERLRAAAGLVGRGVNKVLSTREDPRVLAIVVQRLLEAAQPMAERLPARLEVMIELDGSRTTRQTENLSAMGMLVRTEQPPPVGERFAFTLLLPSGPVEGDARVVRHTGPGREPVTGFGARFTSFASGDRQRLTGYLRSRRALVGADQAVPNPT